MHSGRKYQYFYNCLFVITLAVMQIMFICGCGYRFTPGGEYIDKSIQTVFVDNFSNKTSEANVENIFRRAFIDQFIKGRRFKLVDGRETADAVFRGNIINLMATPLSYNKNNLTAEERVTVTIELIMEEQGTKNVLWTDKSFSAYEDYPFTDVFTKAQNRKQALLKLANDSAEREYRLMMSGF